MTPFSILLKISDIHVSRYYGLSRAPDLRDFCDESLSVIQPDLVLVTGRCETHIPLMSRTKSCWLGMWPVTYCARCECFVLCSLETRLTPDLVILEMSYTINFGTITGLGTGAGFYKLIILNIWRSPFYYPKPTKTYYPNFIFFKRLVSDMIWKSRLC